MLAGKIISISDLLVEVLLSGVQVKKRDMMYAVKGEKTYRFEVEDIEGNVASLVPFSNVAGLSRGTEVFKAEAGLEMEYSDQILGRVFSPYGDPIDKKPIESEGKRTVYPKRFRWNHRCKRFHALDRNQGARFLCADAERL